MSRNRRARLACRVGRQFAMQSPNGQRMRVTVTEYIADTRMVRIRYGNRQCGYNRLTIPCYTNPHGVESFDVFGTRFYANGQVWGRGRIHG